MLLNAASCADVVFTDPPMHCEAEFAEYAPGESAAAYIYSDSTSVEVVIEDGAVDNVYTVGRCEYSL
jgi:hypothetical protein